MSATDVPTTQQIHYLKCHQIDIRLKHFNIESISNGIKRVDQGALEPLPELIHLGIVKSYK
jgi:hypothetical protein